MGNSFIIPYIYIHLWKSTSIMIRFYFSLIHFSDTFIDQEELLIILLMKICTKICHGPPMSLVSVIAFGNSLFHRWRKSLSPAFVFSLLWAASEAKARSSSVCQLLLRFWLFFKKRANSVWVDIAGKRSADMSIYSTQTPEYLENRNWTHFFPNTRCLLRFSH